MIPIELEVFLCVEACSALRPKSDMDILQPVYPIPVGEPVERFAALLRKRHDQSGIRPVARPAHPFIIQINGVHIRDAPAAQKRGIDVANIAAKAGEFLAIHQLDPDHIRAGLRRRTDRSSPGISQAHHDHVPRDRLCDLMIWDLVGSVPPSAHHRAPSQISMAAQ